MKPQDEEKRYILTFRRRRFLAMTAALALLLGSLWFADAYGPKRRSVFSEERAVLIIDPGHGGIDGGAIAFNGVKESELNLAIAQRMQEIAAFYGVETRMTRQDENPRTDPGTYSEREELAYRAELAEEIADGVLISIHQNFFPTSQPSGAQVLYGPGAESRRLGELTHRNLVEALQPANRRVAAPAPGNLYLTSHVRCPVILVECGFLSNFSDLQLLSEPRYQVSLAAVLLSSYLQFTNTPNI